MPSGFAFETRKTCMSILHQQHEGSTSDLIILRTCFNLDQKLGFSTPSATVCFPATWCKTRTSGDIKRRMINEDTFHYGAIQN